MPAERSVRPWLLAALTALAPLSIDAYLPGLPQLSAQLGASASAAQLTLSGCLAGLALGQLAAGPVSDARGRRGPLLSGLAAFVLASLTCALAPSVAVLVVCRFAQGATAAVAVVLARAVVADVHEDAACARAYARLLAVGGVVPVLAPVAGAQLLRLGSWRTILVATAVLGACLLVAVARTLPETLAPAQRRRLGGLRAVGAGFSTLLRDRTFAGYAALQGFAFAAMFAYIAAAPFVVQIRYGLSPAAFSAIFACNALGIVAAAQAGRVLLRRISSDRLVRLGVAVLGAGAAGLLVALPAGSSRWLVLPSLFLVVASVGLILPHAAAEALAGRAPGESGSASALLGVAQFAIGGAVTPLVGLAGERSAVPLTLVVAALAAAAAMALLRWAARPRLLGGRDSNPDSRLQRPESCH